MKHKKVLSWVIMLAIAAFFWFIPVIGEMDPKAFKFLGIFLATIVGFILQPLPMGALALIATSLCAILGIAPLKELTAGWGSTTVWLVVAAFCLARGFSKTGLGRRISLLILRTIGTSTLKVGYAFSFCDLVFGPAVPSFTARSGGLVYPIIMGVNEVYDSKPGPTANRCGSYFIQLEHQITTIVACMFMTSSAVNPASMAIVLDATGISFTWMQWAAMCIVPGLFLVLTVPFLMYKLTKPELKKTPEARQMATDELTKMGPMSTHEKLQLVVFIGCIVLWATSSLTGFDATAVALLAVAFQLLTGVLTWKDILGESGAWDTLVWIGTLITLAGFIGKFGISSWFVGIASDRLAGLSPVAVFVAVIVIFILTHYLFASTTSHMAALMLPCLLLLVSVGIDPLLASFSLLIAANFPGAITHYASGPSPIFFGSGYAKVTTWWKNAGIIAAYNLVIWFAVGGIWWKVLGVF